MDDLFDIFGMSILSSGGKWCRLNNMPCIPLPSCEKFEVDGKCKYSTYDDEDGDDNISFKK